VLRLSGQRAGEVLANLTQKPLPSPRQAALRPLYRPTDGALLDRAMVIWFPAPKSFTGEDVVELHLHGGRAIINAVTSVLAALPAMRLAEPGEFTRRSFENGKCDLTEAEAIADLIHAETEAQRQQALRQMDGALEQLYDGWRDRLKAALAHSEASIDFSEEELPPDLITKQAAALTVLQTEITTHLADHRRGESLREGYRIAILGAPNAGKSSLLNTLAQRDAAIVSSTAGTTRDIVEVQLDLGGYPVILADTAGLREATDSIEREGIRRAQDRASTADLKILLFDGALWPDCDAMTIALRDERSLCIINKADFLKPDARESGNETMMVAGEKALAISLKNQSGLDNLLTHLTHKVAEALHDRGMPVLTRLRHRTALEECNNALTKAINGLHHGQEVALIAEDIRLSMRAIGRITGRVDVEDLLDVIFRDFCIGK